jgi:hypothetical protein
MTPTRHFLAAAALSLTACTPKSESAYIAARDAYRQSLTAQQQTKGDTVLPADSAAMRDLDARIRPVIGPFTSSAVVGNGRFNVQTLLPGYEESGLPDGLLYESPDSTTRVFVSTLGLMRSWIAWEFEKDTIVPRDPIAALRRPEVYTPIFEADAAVVRYADLPVDDKSKHVLAAMLVDRAQDICQDCAPGEIMVGVNAGNRVFVVETAARDTIPVPEACLVAAKNDHRAEELSEAYSKGGASDTTVIEKSFHAENERFATLLECYALHLKTDPRFADLVAQARAIVHSLPDR